MQAARAHGQRGQQQGQGNDAVEHLADQGGNHQHAELEQRVVARTIELEQANEQLLAQIGDRLQVLLGDRGRGGGVRRTDVHLAPQLAAGGLDPASYRSWYAALIDLSLRLSGLGWRNALCETAFVARNVEGQPADGDMDALSVRWPAWHAQLAHFLMDDPLRALRERMGDALARLDNAPPQPDLFADAP